MDQPQIETFVVMQKSSPLELSLDYAWPVRHRDCPIGPFVHRRPWLPRRVQVLLLPVQPTGQAFAAATTFLRLRRRAGRLLSGRKLDACYFQCSWLVSVATNPMPVGSSSVMREREESARAGWHTPGHVWGSITIPPAGPFGKCWLLLT